MNFTVVLLSPFAGWIVDKTRAYFGVMALGLAVSLSALVTSSFDTSINPVILFIVTSAGYIPALSSYFICRFAVMPVVDATVTRQACFAAAIWPTIPLVVPKAATGTAYGLLVSLQNIGLAAGAASVAAVQPPQCNNTFMCSFLILSCCAGKPLYPSCFAVSVFLRPELIVACCAPCSTAVLMATDRHRSGSGQRLLPTPDSRESVALYSPIEEVSTT
jgi:MFS family permease